MKKLVSILIALSMVVGLSPSVFANSSGSTIVLKSDGITLDKTFEVFPEVEKISNMYKSNIGNILQAQVFDSNYNIVLDTIEVYSQEKIILEDEIIYEYKVSVESNGDINIARVFGPKTTLSGGWEYYSFGKSLRNGIAQFTGHNGNGQPVHVILSNVYISIYNGVNVPDTLPATGHFIGGSVGSSFIGAGFESGYNINELRSEFVIRETDVDAYAKFGDVARFRVGDDTWKFDVFL